VHVVRAVVFVAAPFTGAIFAFELRPVPPRCHSERGRFLPTRNLLFPGFELPQPVFPPSGEFEQVQIAQHLKLLPNLVADMTK
jgi:hypothetical protein